MSIVHPSIIQGTPRDAAPARGGWLGLRMYLIFFGWTLFSLFVYTRFSQLGDSKSYLTGAYDDDVQARTQLIAMISSRVVALAQSELLAHIAFSFFAASGVWYLVSQAKVRGRYWWPLLAIVLNPNFGVWASVIGRESFFVGLLGFFMGAVLSYFHRPRLWKVIIALACVAGMSFIRGPYGIGMGLFFLIFLAYRSGPRTRLSIGVQVTLLATLCLAALVVAWPDLDRYVSDEVLPRAKSYFTINSDTTRTWISLHTTADLLASLWWSLPLALVGPTPAEVMTRPIMLPFLLSGLVVLCSLLYSVVVAFRAPPGRARKILLVGWLPAIALILIAYVPFGIYNPGSAIRYASCFLLFLIFPSMLLSSITAETQARAASA